MYNPHGCVNTFLADGKHMKFNQWLHELFYASVESNYKKAKKHLLLLLSCIWNSYCFKESVYSMLLRHHNVIRIDFGMYVGRLPCTHSLYLYQLSNVLCIVCDIVGLVVPLPPKVKTFKTMKMFNISWVLQCLLGRWQTHENQLMVTWTFWCICKTKMQTSQKRVYCCSLVVSEIHVVSRSLYIVCYYVITT